MILVAIRWQSQAGTGVPMLQEPSILQHLNAVYASYGGGINNALCRLAVVWLRMFSLSQMHASYVIIVLSHAPRRSLPSCRSQARGNVSMFLVLQTSPAGKRGRQKRSRNSMGGSQPSQSQQQDEDDDDPTLQMRGNDSRRRTADVQFNGDRSDCNVQARSHATVLRPMHGTNAAKCDGLTPLSSGNSLQACLPDF